MEYCERPGNASHLGTWCISGSDHGGESADVIYSTTIPKDEMDGAPAFSTCTKLRGLSGGSSS